MRSFVLTEGDDFSPDTWAAGVAPSLDILVLWNQRPNRDMMCQHLTPSVCILSLRPCLVFSRVES